MQEYTRVQQEFGYLRKYNNHVSDNRKSTVCHFWLFCHYRCRKFNAPVTRCWARERNRVKSDGWRCCWCADKSWSGSRSLQTTSEWGWDQSRRCEICPCWWNRLRSTRRSWVGTRRTSASRSPAWRYSPSTPVVCVLLNRSLTLSLSVVGLVTAQVSRCPSVRQLSISSLRCQFTVYSDDMLIIIIIIIRQLIRLRNMSIKSLQGRHTAYASRN